METRLPKDPAYERLFKGRTLTGSVSYWLGPGHVLMVENSFVVESCRRFDLDDLELVVVQPNSVRKVAVFILSLCLLVFGGLALMALLRVFSGGGEDATALAIAASIPAAGSAAALAWAWFPGRFCRVYIRTAVQTLTAPGIVRVPKARHFVARLQAALPAGTAAPDAPAP